MYAKFKTQESLSLPIGFKSLLKSLITEILRFQPGNLVKFCSFYFEVIQQEQESSYAAMTAMKFLSDKSMNFRGQFEQWFQP